jgi:hypothetical protein
MSHRLGLTLLASAFCYPMMQAATGVDVAQIQALAKAYFRDSTEIPMNVAVTTLVTDRSGKVKHQSQSIVVMVFRGYMNQAAGSFSLRTNSGMFNAAAARDSMSGDLAAFFAGGLISMKSSHRAIEIQQASAAGKPAVVIVKDGECPQLALMPRWMFPQHPCGSAQFTVNLGSRGALTFQHFSFESSGSPVAAKVTYLGDVQVLAFHAEVQFQEAMLPGDPNPYLWPMEATTSTSTNKGRVTISNRYSPKK